MLITKAAPSMKHGVMATTISLKFRVSLTQCNAFITPVFTFTFRSLKTPDIAVITNDEWILITELYFQ